MFVTPARVLWLYGLSGSGKTALARKIVEGWHAQGLPAVLLDGDELRSGLSQGLGFSTVDRAENIRRAAEVAALLSRQGVRVVAALVTPLRVHRDLARAILHEVPLTFHFVDCPLETCRQRDPAGLYARAARGEVREIAGLDTPFEEPPPGAEDWNGVDGGV